MITFHYHPAAKSISATSESLRSKTVANQHQLASWPAGAIVIFTCSKNAAMGDNSMYCMIPYPFLCTAFGKVRATPD